MKVSIITVCYNSESTIEDTIKSVVDQDFPDIEYIILDGASNDETMNIVNQYQDYIAIIKSETDNGMYDALNKGIKLASGDIIAILNSDDIYCDKKVISDVVNLFESSNSDAVYADLVYVKRDNLKHVIRYWRSGKYKRGKFLRGWMPPHPTFFVKKWVYNDHGVFNLNLVSAADYELMLRFIHKHEIKISYLSRVIVKMREGGMSNISVTNRLRANREDRKAWELNGLAVKPYTMILKPLRKIIQFIKK